MVRTHVALEVIERDGRSARVIGRGDGAPRDINPLGVGVGSRDSRHVHVLRSVAAQESEVVRARPVPDFVHRTYLIVEYLVRL